MLRVQNGAVLCEKSASPSLSINPFSFVLFVIEEEQSVSTPQKPVP